MTDSPPIRVVLVDDHPLILRALHTQLDPHPRIDIVETFDNAEAAVTFALTEQPEVVVFDITLGGMSGLEGAERLRLEAPEIAVVILSMHADDEYVLRAVRCGAAGYVLKSGDPEQIEQAIEAAAAGDVFYSPQVSRVLIQGVAAAGDKRSALAPREREVLTRIAQGFLNKEIADQLSLSVRTIESYRERLMKKLDLHSVADLTRYAIAEGLVSAK